MQTGAGVVFEPNSPRFRVMIIKTTRKKIDMAVPVKTNLYQKAVDNWC